MSLIRHPTRAPGVFEQEQGLREIARRARRKAAKRPLDRPAQHQTQGSEHSEGSSVRSSSGASWKEPPQTSLDVEVDVDRDSIDIGNLEGQQTVEPDSKNNKEGTTPAQQGTGVNTLVNPNGGPGLLLDSAIPPQLTIGAANIDNTGGEVHDSSRDAENTAIDGASISKSHGSFHRLILTRLRQLFSRETRCDRGSGEMEVCLLEFPARYDIPWEPTLTKLPMDDRQVRDALANLTPRYRLRWRPSLLEQYRSLGPQILLFVRLGQEVEPVRVQIADDGDTIIPYEHCRTWQMTQTVLARTVGGDRKRGVHEGRYDICNESGAKIPLGMWTNVCHCGLEFLDMAQFETHHQTELKRPGRPRKSPTHTDEEQKKD
ncbi:hypothetical protein ACJZ2D_014105 [Fusarium nematophilum]